LKKAINFIFGVHNHQPVGNLPFIFEDSYQKAYLPFLEILHKHPDVKFTIHNSGILLEWIEKNHPEYISLLKEMVKRDQLEIKTGGYYEPILPIIPDEDRYVQIKKLTGYIKELTGYDSTGMWLTERVWEPHLAEVLSKAKIKHISVDESHFKLTGFSKEQLRGYFITEEQGHKLTIFPISKDLRYLIPFSPVSKVIDYFKEIASEDESKLIVLDDDGEKFGGWPNTFKWIYEERWLENFLTALESESSWIKLYTFSEFMKKFPPLGRIYLPTASYPEMLEWSGGFWRNYLVKYPEINNMQKKMFYLSKWAREIENKEAYEHILASQCNDVYWHGIFGGVYIPSMKMALYRHMIEAERLLEEQSHNNEMFLSKKVFDFNSDGHDEVILSSKFLGVYITSYNGGTIFELDYKVKPYNIFATLARREESYHKTIKEKAGESKFRESETKESEFKNGETNESKSIEGEIRDSNTEEKEEGIATIHHIEALKEVGFKKFLNYDKWPNYGFRNYILSYDTNIDSFQRREAQQFGNFANGAYTFQLIENGVKLNREERIFIQVYHSQEVPGCHCEPLKVAWQSHQDKLRNLYQDKVSEESRVEHKRDERSFIQGNESFITIKKRYEIEKEKSILKVNYLIENKGPLNLFFTFAVEQFFSMLSGYDENAVKYHIPDVELEDRYMASYGEIKDIGEVIIKNYLEGFNIILKFTPKATVWRFPIETVSQSEAGMERTYQSSAVVPNWKLKLEPNQTFSAQILLKILERS